MTISTDEQIAAVDLGSNSFHLVVARIVKGHLHIIDRLRETVRFAAGLDEGGYLTEEAQQQAYACLARFGERVSNMPSNRVRAVGTNTLRKARNAEMVLVKAKQALGHPIGIISGVEEARLIHLGISNGSGDTQGRHLVVDIGGGSTELIVGERNSPLYMESLYMGCVNISRTYFGDDVLSAKNMARAMLAARLELRPVKHRFIKFGWQVAIGSSGTVKAISKVVKEMGWCDEGISKHSLEQLRNAIVGAGKTKKLDFLGLRDDRKPVLAGGVAVLTAVFDMLNIKHIHVSDLALREGLLYDQMGRAQHDDIREQGVETLMLRYSVDKAQAKRVAETAAICFAKVAKAWAIEKDYATKLDWAARLHEIGLTVAHNHFHKHGAYLLEHVDLPGFSQFDQRFIATLIRNHRRKFSTTSLKLLPEDQHAVLTKLCILLRISVLLRRSHHDNPLPDFVLVVDKKNIRIEFPKEWLAEHPLNDADLKQETAFLKSAKYTLTVGCKT